MHKQCILFCGNFKKEVESLKIRDRHDDIEILYYQGRCGLAPVDWSVMREIVPASCKTLHVVSGGCIRNLPEEYGSIYNQYGHDLNHCLHLLVNPDLIFHYASQGFYLVTPGWLDRWKTNLEEQGFNRKTAADFYSDSAKAILLLDTGVNPMARRNLADFSAYVGLPAETVNVGLDYLSLLLNNTLLKGRLALQEDVEAEYQADDRKEVADFTMALDLLNAFVRLRDENEVLNGIRETFFMLFAPQAVFFRESENDSAIERPDCFSLEMKGSTGRIGYLDVIGLSLPRYKGHYVKLALKIINICGMAIENARHYKMIKDLSETDGLTGLANRRRLEEHLGAEWRRALRSKEFISLVMIDIDYFKDYNDCYGHQAGDDCLKKVACVLNDQIHRVGDLAARYGGEEFTLVLPGTTPEGALGIAESIRHSVESLKIRHETSKVSDHVTVSMGVASAVPAGVFTVEELLAEADKGLFEAKNSGRNRIVSCFPQTVGDGAPRKKDSALNT